MLKEDFAEISLDLQRLSFNLADDLETLNFHTRFEAVKELSHGVLRDCTQMLAHIQALLRNRERIEEYFPALDAELLYDEVADMDDLLELLRKSTGDSKNYRDFVAALPRLFALCDKWGKQDPLNADEFNS